MAGLVFSFPTNFELNTVVQEYSVQREKFIGETILPFEEQMTQVVMWDEKDNERGMTYAHNMDTDPKVVGRPGSRVKQYEPIYFKEDEPFKESDFLRARQLGTLNGVINIDQMVLERVRTHEDRNYLRAEWLRWQTLQGELHVNENGVRVDETFPVQVYYALTPWTNTAQATPLKDDMACALLFRGTGASAQGAYEYMNQTTANTLLSNTNQNDIAGFRASENRSTSFSIDEANKIRKARGLPEIAVYDEGWNDDAGNYRTFIPDGVSIVIGKRPAGQSVGKVAMTPSIHRVKNGMPAPGMFAFVLVNGQPSNGVTRVDLTQLGQAANPKLNVIAGFYGGPFLRYPRSVIVKRVF